MAVAEVRDVRVVSAGTVDGRVTVLGRDWARGFTLSAKFPWICWLIVDLPA